MAIIVVWILLSIVAGAIAASKGRSGAGFFLLSVFLSPLVGIPWALTSNPGEPLSSSARPLTQAKSDASSGSIVEIRVVAGGSSGKLRGKVSKVGDCWVRPGIKTSVRGFEIPDGMIYVGRSLPAIDERMGVEPALIDPTLATAKESSRDGEGMGYWPSYSSIPPSCRTAYLEWLADGRKDPSACIGYVFLFVYGLERRLLADYLQHTAVKDEAPQLVAELERLLALYARSGSLVSYVGSLLEFLAAREYVERGTVPRLRTDRFGLEMPLSVRIAVGSRAARSEPLDARLALAWVKTDPQISLRTPATRCAEEFERLFAIEYEQAYASGLKLTQCKRRISAIYRPASASFARTFDLKLDLPDVASLVGPRTRLHDIVTNCTEALDSYSRFIGREPENRGSIAAAALLPDKLLRLHPPQDLQDLRVRVEGKLGNQGMVVAPAIDVLLPWLPTDGSPQRKADAVEASRFLERIGFGIEPDVRFGGSRISKSDEIVLFRLSSEQRAPSGAYTAAATLLSLAAAVAMADGELSREEASELRVHVCNALFLDEPERLRLVALLEWFARNPPKLPAARKMPAVDEASRRSAAQFLVQVATVDGSANPVEVRTLTKIYGLLALDPQLVHADLHSALGGGPLAEDPVTVVPAGPESYGYRIPKPEDIKSSRKVTITLSADEIAKKQNEASAVARLLSTVFVNDETVPAAQAAANTSTRTYGTLDVNHSRLLELVGANAEWSAAEFERLVDECKLLPDGALETLNECALEACDEPVLEVGDVFRVNMEVYREMVK